MRERPALAAQVLDVAHLDLHFFAHFPDQAILGGLPRLGEARQGAVDPGDKAWRTGQQDLVTAGDQHDHAR
ncbi:hypothetical protein D3C73_1535510 [compost metagenome]